MNQVSTRIGTTIVETLIITAIICACTAVAQPLRQYNVEGKGFLHSISIAVDCKGNMYSTTGGVSSFMNIWSNYPDGPVTLVPTQDSSGADVPINEISWDDSRGVLWGSTGWPSIGDGVSIYTLTTEGSCTFQFHVKDPTWPFGGADGLTYDPDPTWPEGSLWISWNQSIDALHYTTSGTLIKMVILPMEQFTPNNISGICATPTGLWCARTGPDYHCITFHKKTGGPPLPGYTIDTTPLLMIEGLECECNPRGFLEGTCLLWVKEVTSPHTVTAFKIPSGSCGCTEVSQKK